MIGTDGVFVYVAFADLDGCAVYDWVVSASAPASASGLATPNGCVAVDPVLEEALPCGANAENVEAEGALECDDDWGRLVRPALKTLERLAALDDCTAYA